MAKEYSVGSSWIAFGFVQQIALGFSINKYSLSIDLGPFFFTWEW